MSFAELEQQVLGGRKLTIAVAGPRGAEVFDALAAAHEKRLADFILCGDEAAIRLEAGELADARIISASDDEAAALAAVEEVRSGRADMVMKGKIPTAVLLKAILAEKTVYNRGRLLSHILILQNPEGKFLGVTDGGMNLYPDVEQKQDIIRSAVECFHSLGVPKPKVAVLAAMEKENPKITESMDAAELTRRYKAGEFPDCIVEGPIALDLAVSKKACELKEWKGEIRGDSDILLVHDISSGNYLGKSLIYLAGYSGGGLVLGGGRPIILLSRSDSATEKYQSILLALALERHRQQLL